jgi:hypothetical protein
MTEIKYCGKNNSIDELIQILESETLDEKFFMRYNDNYTSRSEPPIWVNHCPIKLTKKGYRLFGNFEDYSFAFNIISDDKELCNRLIKSIRNNKGWSMYYDKHRIDHNQLNLF